LFLIYEYEITCCLGKCSFMVVTTIFFFAGIKLVSLKRRI
jgi:hypothetical protein